MRNASTHLAKMKLLRDTSLIGLGILGCGSLFLFWTFSIVDGEKSIYRQLKHEVQIEKCWNEKKQFDLEARKRGSSERAQCPPALH